MPTRTDPGRIARRIIDRQLPTKHEKRTLQDLAAGVVQLQVSTANVTAAAPTDAELDAAFGEPAAAGAGFVALLDDDGAGTDLFLIATDGTSWYYTHMSQAT